ncbi:hypothetical protein FPOAC1_009109 [Fusarium poae]|uniref:hypothetical protein n=1 Tax=Fusarium poae TaxID=36050 RepID=UPI001CEAC28E|nr:hypothetical protein FPOAC1_009109 [Fusarium poae]KAG8669710.1 hypothetical protein FPOAC1_009109 [Fusarium poae]
MSGVHHCQLPTAGGRLFRAWNFTDSLIISHLITSHLLISHLLISHLLYSFRSSYFYYFNGRPCSSVVGDQPITGTSIQDFIDDSNVTTARPPSTAIDEPSQLTATERHGLRNHLRKWIQIVDNKKALVSQLVITSDHRRRFFDAIFASWTSRKNFKELVRSLVKKRIEGGRIQVSVWSQDLPLSGKRKRDDEEQPVVEA